jgi:hypothetical protein
MLRLLRWLPFIFFAAFIGLVIYIANSGQGSKYWSFLDQLPYGDKLGHFLLMGTLCLLLNVALRARTFQGGRATVLLGSLIIAGIATAEEITQLFLPSRTFALTDLAADYLGIFLAGRLAVWICRDR